jgi:DNA-directed RNA polymerase subunit RPC12/RpoP
LSNPTSSPSDSSSWTYECVHCGYEIDSESIQAMPTCPKCDGPRMWEFHSGVHSADDVSND